MIDIGFDLKRINPEFYEFVSECLTIVEEDKEGKAELTCCLAHSQGKEFIRLSPKKEQTGILKYTTNNECADGIIIESDTQNRTIGTIYIIELKTTMGTKTWTHVQEKFRGSTLRALAFASSLGISGIRSIKYFTAYENAKELDNVVESQECSERIKNSTATRRPRSGVNKRELEEWDSDTIALFPNNTRFPHQKVILQKQNGINTGSLTI